jgi:hypothetical protein
MVPAIFKLKATNKLSEHDNDSRPQMNILSVEIQRTFGQLRQSVTWE